MSQVWFVFTDMSEEGDEEEFRVAGRRVLCPRCDGAGHVDNPAFSNGFTQEDFDEDPDFKYEYLAGVYDVLCPECRGERVVIEPDEERMSEQMIDRYRAWQAAQAEIAYENHLREMGVQY